MDLTCWIRFKWDLDGIWMAFGKLKPIWFCLNIPPQLYCTLYRRGMQRRRSPGVMYDQQQTAQAEGLEKYAGMFIFY